MRSRSSLLRGRAFPTIRFSHHFDCLFGRSNDSDLPLPVSEKIFLERCKRSLLALHVHKPVQCVPAHNQIHRAPNLVNRTSDLFERFDNLVLVCIGSVPHGPVSRASILSSIHSFISDSTQPTARRPRFIDVGNSPFEILSYKDERERPVRNITAGSRRIDSFTPLAQANRVTGKIPDIVCRVFP